MLGTYLLKGIFVQNFLTIINKGFKLFGDVCITVTLNFAAFIFARKALTMNSSVLLIFNVTAHCVLIIKIK